LSFCLTTLIENHPGNDPLLGCEHGLSILIESSEKTVLLDTGQTGLFLRNAKTLKKDLESVDQIILSHGHYDHVGGVQPLIRQLHNRPEIWVGDSFFEPKCCQDSENHYRPNGVDFTPSDLCSLGFPLCFMTEEHLDLGGGIHLFRNFPQDPQQDLSAFRYGKPDYPPDDFRDEIVVGLSMSYGMVVVCGCAHRGILPILQTIRQRSGQPIAGIIGGTHLRDAAEPRMIQVIEALQPMSLRLVACSHCTGDAQAEQLRTAFPNTFFLNRTGSCIEIQEDGIFCRN
jgi:7,8-dihydropterin-6-yl-methyl-4-(beta-D-ribofuranosyl)aminobenzene 5'-phosphate synthase